MWEKWNDDIKTGKLTPPGMSSSDTLFVNNGCVTITSDSSLSPFDRDTIQNMAKVGLEHTQIDLHSDKDLKRAKDQGFEFAIKAFNLRGNSALLDTQSGFVYADKACRFALHKAESLGVQFVFGELTGKFVSFLENTESQVTGVRTADGAVHSAELTILACGGWTPSLLPQLDNLCETTAGSVAIFQLPPDKTLWDRFAPENFPTWSYVLCSPLVESTNIRSPDTICAMASTVGFTALLETQMASLRSDIVEQSSQIHRLSRMELSEAFRRPVGHKSLYVKSLLSEPE